MRKLFASIALIVGALSLSAPANAAGSVTWGQVTYMSGGWSIPMMLVKTTTTPINPDNCSAGAGNGYAIDPGAADLQLLTSLLMTAYAQGHVVRLAISGCYSSWPAIVGVEVQPAAS